MPTELINVRSIFDRVVEISSEAERNAYLLEACAGAQDIRLQVEALLKANADAGSFLQSPPAGVSATIDQPPTELPGTVIGRYKLLEQVGEGGMGIVFVAEQTEPVRRRVALKIIKPGMDTKQVIARFEAERQALAMMDHPNIARVLDAGTTEASRPYFVMELVRGMPITEYCDKVRLSPRQRLELFIDVCQAVQHAHQKGIIHRDLKPSNVMVTTNDGRPVVKVIDFGVAKAVGQQLTERTMYTALTQLVGTPLYMSPEQAELTSNDVDTRSDVYSLGVLLYELLTGQTPFDKETLAKAGLDEMRRIIREDEPLRPSRRFSTLGVQAISTASQHRGVDERRLSRILSGELDWIVMKALEKDRSRRYESASSLAADIQRYLSDEPVLACPPTTMYRFQKFARKHKPALATAAAIALCLILGTTVSAWQAVRATTAEAQANANEQKAVANEAQAKEAAAAEAQQRQRAEANEQRANTQRDEVKALNEKLHHTLYVAHMNLARHAWDAGATDQVEELLAHHRPKPGHTDLRGFEWNYLYRLCHGELITLTGHAGLVRSVAYSPDGKRLASASTDKTVKIWDAQTGRELLSLKGHTAAVNSVAFSPDGKRLASGSGSRNQTTKAYVGGEVKVWDAHTGQELFSLLNGRVSVVNSVAFSPDSKRLVSGGGTYDANTRAFVAAEATVWDAQSGEEILSLKGHTNSVYNVAFSPDGKRLVSSDWDTRMRVWDAQSGQELRSEFVYDRPSFSPDGKRLANAGTVRDTETGKELLSVKSVGIGGMVYSPDGKRLVGASKDKKVRMFDAQTGDEIFSLKGHTGIDETLAFSPDGKRLALANGETVKIWDATTGPEAQTISGPANWVSYAAFSPDGKRLAGTSSDNMVRVWDAMTGQELLAIQGGGGSSSVAFSPDGKRLASGPRDGPVKVWDAQTGKELLSSKATGWNLAFSPDGTRLADRLKIWDAQTGQELFAFKRGGMGVAFSPDGKRLALGGGIPIGSVGMVTILDSQTGQELLTLQDLVGGVMSVAFSPDGKRLASGSYRGAVKVWDVQTGQELLSLKGHTAAVNSVAFSPDGKRLATHGQLNTVKIWDAQTGDEMLTLKGGPGRSVAFSPDGHRLIGPGDSGLKIWDATPLPEKP